jgi:hypothetical protein
MRFQIHWKALLFGHVVANVLLWHPRFHINEAQFATERKDRIPLRQKGWQDALQNVYPFKINRFVVDNGEVVYLEAGEKRPLRLADLNLVSDNIRSIQEPNHPYPSWFRASAVIFDRGKLSMEGRVNYLMKPFSGIEARYTVTDVPMDAVTTASHHINVVISGGTFASDGFIEYSPRVTNIDVHNVTFDRIKVTYIHRPETKNAEAKRIEVAGKTVKKRRIGARSILKSRSSTLNAAFLCSTTRTAIRPLNSSSPTPI